MSTLPVHKRQRSFIAEETQAVGHIKRRDNKDFEFGLDVEELELGSLPMAEKPFFRFPRLNTIGKYMEGK